MPATLGQTALVGWSSFCESVHPRLQPVRLFYIYATMFGESGNNETKTRFTFYAPGFVREYGAKRKRRPTN